MNDNPTPVELLDAIASLLTNEVLPDTTAGTRHAVRIAANLCRIVERQLVAGDHDATRTALAALLDCDDGADLASLLDERLASNDSEFDASVGDLLYADVCHRVDIAKPGYRTPTL